MGRPAGAPLREGNETRRPFLTVSNRRLACLFLGLTGIAPFLVSSKLGLIDPFTHGFVSASILLLNAGHLNLHSSPIEFVPASSFLVGTVSLMTGIDPVSLEYIPFAGPLGFASAYLLGRRVFRNHLVALLIANVVSYRFFAFWLYSIWPHAIGHALFLLFVSTLLLPAAKQPAKLLVLWILYVAINFYSYTTELWIWVLLGTILMVAWARTRLDPQAKLNAWKPFSVSILTASVVLFLGFNQTLYGGYLPRLSTIQSELVTGVEYYISTIFKSSPPVPYAWIPPPSPWFLTLLQIIWFAMTFGPIVLILRYVRGFRPARHWLARLTRLQILGGALITVWLADIFVYIPIGGFKASLLRVPILTWPYLSLLLITDLRSVRTRWQTGTRAPRPHGLFYSGALMIVSVSIFSLTITGAFFVESPSHYASAVPSAEWLHDHRAVTTFVYSDQNTEGQYSIVFARHNLFLDPNHLFRQDSFSSLVNPPSTDGADDFFRGAVVVINLDLVTSQTSAGGWIDFEPLAPHLQAIDSNINLAQVYNDGHTWILVGA